MKFETIQFSEVNNYVAPKVIEDAVTKCKLNGKNNEFFKDVKKLMLSPTNGGIIKSYINYIIGEGLIDKTGTTNIGKYLSKKDVRLLCQDYKMYGQFSIKIVWTKGSKKLGIEPKPSIIKWISTAKLGLQIDDYNEVNGYWYSYDWSKQHKYKPKFYPKFNGMFKEYDEEILTVFRPDDEELFPQPDWYSGMQWANVELELANSGLSHILNGFSAGKVINLGGGAPQDEGLKERYFNQVKEKLTGSTNNNKFFINYYDETSGAKMEVTNIESKGLDAQLVYFSEEAKRQIMAAHGVTNPILFGVREGSGLGANTDEMKEALKTLYRSNINPLREEIIDGLEYVLRYIEPEIELVFKDFKELEVEENPTNVETTPKNDAPE